MITKQRKLVKIEDEVWIVIPDSNNRYQISNYGRVKSFAYNKTNGKILKNYEMRGFKTVHLCQNENKRKTYYLHKLMAEIWVAKPSEDYSFVCFKDGNRKNMHVKNLAWMTKEMFHEHQKHLRQKAGFSKSKKIINNSKLKEDDIKLLKQMLQRGTPQTRIAELFCISEMQVTRIKRGENWSHVSI